MSDSNAHFACNLRFQNALTRKPQNVPPIWFMRQAGRYHRHYQNLRERYSFMQLCKEPELAAEVALGPIADFDFDVAILFSDLLFPLEALGMGLSYDPSPRFDRRLDAKVMAALLPPDEAISGLEFQKLAVQATRERLPSDKSLIGFVGGPWTLFLYALTGGHSADFSSASPDFALFQEFSQTMIELLKRNIALQLDGGAEIVMIFDPAAGVLNSTFFDEHIRPGIQELARNFCGRLGYYSRQTTPAHVHALFEDKNLAGLGIDHNWDFSEALRGQHHGFIQGNFDQALLLLDTPAFERQLEEWLEPLVQLSPDDRAGWVCGLGHGVLPKTPEQNVRLFVEQVREWFSR